jgi:hypothetical protein
MPIQIPYFPLSLTSFPHLQSTGVGQICRQNRTNNAASIHLLPLLLEVKEDTPQTASPCRTSFATSLPLEDAENRRPAAADVLHR